MTPAPATLKKRSVTIAGHATSVSMENIFWDRLTDIAKTRGQSVSSIIRDVDAARTGNLSQCGSACTFLKTARYKRSTAKQAADQLLGGVRRRLLLLRWRLLCGRLRPTTLGGGEADPEDPPDPLEPPPRIPLSKLPTPGTFSSSLFKPGI